MHDYQTIVLHRPTENEKVKNGYFKIDGKEVEKVKFGETIDLTDAYLLIYEGVR